VDSPRKATIYGPLPTHGDGSVALVLHTTETRGMPGFNYGDTAPHYVYDLASRVWTKWAEYEDGYVGTMKGHSAGHINCKAFQVEIIGYSNGQYDPWIGDASEENMEDLAGFFAWAVDRYGIGIDVTPTPDGGWLYGVNSPYRMSFDQWRSFSGLTAHGAVPGNTHWDTGVLDLEYIRDLAIDADVPIPPPIQPPPVGDDYMRPTLREGDGYVNGSRPEVRGAVVGLQQQLAYHGHADRETADKTTCAADGAFGSGTDSAVKSFQSAKGLVADGITGDKSWTELDKPLS